MYNLLIKYDDDQSYWEKNQIYSLEINRVFEYTEENIIKRFQGPDFTQLQKLPCLFTYEGKDVIGYIGFIQSVKRKVKDIELTYMLSDDSPKILLNEDQVFKNLGIEINTFERTRTHWAVKDIDLFQITTKMLFEKYDKGQSQNLLSHGEMKKIWGDYYKNKKKKLIFLSHRARDRGKVSKIKEQLEKEDISCFVAHDDIKPGSTWQNEIIKALMTMDVFIGCVTDEFHLGSWTDQEIGYAYKRGVPRIFIKLGKTDPMGFISMEQALETTWEEAPQKIIKHLHDEEIIFNINLEFDEFFG